MNHSLTEAFAKAEALLIERFGTVTLAKPAEDFRARAAARRAQHTKDSENA